MSFMESVNASSNLSSESTKKKLDVFLKLYYGNIDGRSIRAHADICEADFNCRDIRIPVDVYLLKVNNRNTIS